MLEKQCIIKKNLRHSREIKNKIRYLGNYFNITFQFKKSSK
jgi:hypothetical protein